MRRIQAQGVHHITLVGADRATTIGFWEGVLGMPFMFDQPNLDNTNESHLYFDPGDGRLITVFTNEERVPDPARTPIFSGCVHHIAFNVSHAVFAQAVERLDERGVSHSGVKDRGFMDSIYFEDPLGLTIELASTGSSRRIPTPTPRCCSKRTSCASSAATITSARSTSPTRSSCSSCARARRFRLTVLRRIRSDP